MSVRKKALRLVISVVLGVQSSPSSLERYIGSVALCSSSSSKRNMGMIAAKALFLTYFSAVVDENVFFARLGS